MRRLRILLIGTGRWGKNILRTLKEMPEVEVVLDNQTDIDGVIVATPGSTHAQVALPYIKQGIPTFIEKPMTTKLADANAIARAANQSGAPVTVGHIHLHNPAWVKSQELISTIGPIQSLYFEGMAPGPVRDDMSVLWDWGPHPISMALSILKNKPTHVQAWGELITNPRRKIHDIVTIRLTFPRKVTLLCSLSWLSPTKRCQLTIIGSKGSIIFDDRADRKIQIVSPTGSVSHPRYSGFSPLELEMRAFIQSIKPGTKPTVTISDGQISVAILEAAAKSIQRDGLAVKIS